VNRRLLTILLPLATASLAAGCTTFSDNDAVARVNDVELSSEMLRARLTEIEAPTDVALDANQVRQDIAAWIRSESVDPSQAEAAYANGAEASGTVCPQVIVIDALGAAESAMADLEAGADFDDVSAVRNIEPLYAGESNRLGCIPTSDLPFDNGDPFIDALRTLTAQSPYALVSLPPQPGSPNVYVVTRLTPFNELSPEEMAVVLQNAPVNSQDIDIYVDPRYGAYDPETGVIDGLG
jgi:hypothetical protein